MSKAQALFATLEVMSPGLEDLLEGLAPARSSVEHGSRIKSCRKCLSKHRYK